jgi:hypothetical protein
MTIPANKYPKTDPRPKRFASGTNNTADARNMIAWKRKEF